MPQNKMDKCTREMMGYSALCSLQPKSKICDNLSFFSVTSDTVK